MAHNFNQVPNRRNPVRVNKWNYYPRDVLPLWVADMDFQAPKPILDALHKAVDHGVLGYELPSLALKETVAARMERLHSWKVDPEAVIATTGVVSGLNLAGRAFCTSRRGYLVQTPVYNEFHTIKDNLSIPKLDAPLREWRRKGFIDYEIDWDVFEKQVRKAGVFLLCNPHNPVGKIYSRRDLLRMAHLCIENDVVIVSDEIHSELLLDDNRFTTMASLSKEIANHTVTLIAPSKTFNVPGLFCGFAIIPSPELRARYERVVDQLRMHVNSMGLFAAQAAFSGKCDPWLADLRAHLTGNRDALIAYVREYFPEVNLTRPQATYLAWLDCREWVRSGRIEGSPFDFFLKEAKVALAAGHIYGPGLQTFVRLNFGCTRSTLMQALERMRKAIYR